MPISTATQYVWTVYSGYGAFSGSDKTEALPVRCVRGSAAASHVFVDNGNGTTTDNTTGLTWQRQDDGNRRTWQAALNYCENLILGGASDWKVPDVKELQSIADYTKFSPAIDTTVFPGTLSGYYWSSSSYYGSNTNYAWIVFFDHGLVYYVYEGYSYYARCVRP